MLKNYIAAFSLANIIFIKVWANLFYIDEKQIYYMKDLPEITSYLAIAFNVLGLSLLFFFLIKLKNKNNLLINRGVVLFLTLLMLLPIYYMGEAYVKSIVGYLILVFGKSVMLIILGTIGIIVLYYLYYKYQEILSFLLAFALIASPFVVITFGQLVLGIISSSPKVTDVARVIFEKQTERKNKSSPRVVWLIFDELDARVAFFERPSSINLPEFDRLSRNSIFSMQAFPPGSATVRSIPALLTGKIVEEARPNGDDELLVKFAGESTSVDWKSQANIFLSAGLLGVHSGLIGWYHPYGKVFGDNVAYSSWYQGGNYTLEIKDTVYKNMVEQGKFLLPLTGRRQHIEAYKKILADTKRAVSTNNYDFIFVHLPVPHAPFMYDQDKESFTLFADPVKGYLPQLNLADKTMGEIRREMEDAGQWENTTLIVSSDHWWRKSVKFDGKTDHRVPFIIKMPEQRQGLVYMQPFNTVLTHDLVLSILKGECVSELDVINWLDIRRTIGESPYYDRGDKEQD